MLPISAKLALLLSTRLSSPHRMEAAEAVCTNVLPQPRVNPEVSIYIWKGHTRMEPYGESHGSNRHEDILSHVTLRCTYERTATCMEAVAICKMGLSTVPLGTAKNHQSYVQLAGPHAKVSVSPGTACSFPSSR